MHVDTIIEKNGGHIEDWTGVVAPNRVLPMGWIEPFDIQTECKQMVYAKFNC